MKKVSKIILIIGMVFTITACSAGASTPQAVVSPTPSSAAVPAATQQSTDNAKSTAENPTPALDESSTGSTATIMAENSKPDEESGDYSYDAATAVPIVLKGSAIEANNAGVTVEGSVATITEAGTYLVSGSLSDGQIVVDTKSKDLIRLVFNGVDISSSRSAPIYIPTAKKVVIILSEGTQNTLSDGNAYDFAIPAEEEPAAAVYSKANLSIAGSGSLTVNANFRDGISSKDGLTIAGGKLTVNAVDDGVIGKDYIFVKDAELSVNAQGDGLKSDNQDDAEKGYISVESGTLQVTAGRDAINAETDVLVSGGTFALTSGGGSAKTASKDNSSKGIKGGVSVVIDGGTFKINSADDTIHSNGSVTINGGTYELSSGDDGVHASVALTINNGDIQITKSYEGIESSLITINGGTVHLISSDDGVNVAGGMDGSGGQSRPGGGQDFFTYTGDKFLYIRGGYLVVDAKGDGLDVNGAVEMTGGLVLVNGPTEQMNGPLDYDAGFNIAGGVIVATGSSGMAMAPGASSMQNSLMVYLTATQPAGTLVHIQNSKGEDILTFAPAKQYQSVALSSPALVNGESYTIFTGGNSTGTAVDGYYQGGSYTAGTQVSTVKISSTVTTVGTGGMGGRGPRR